MSYSINNNKITLTRGDSLRCEIRINNSDGVPYTPTEGDKIRFAMKKTYSDTKPILIIDIPYDTMTLEIRPEDTKELSYGRYVYDIQITKSNGDVDTFIAKASILLTEEVD